MESLSVSRSKMVQMSPSLSASAAPFIPSFGELDGPTATASELAAIRKQVEFYMGNASLWRDFYLQRLIAQRPDRYVPVDVFLSFPKIQALTTDWNTLMIALQQSTKLQVSGSYVRAINPLPVYHGRKDGDRTLYMGNFPVGSNLGYIRKCVKPFGKATSIMPTILGIGLAVHDIPFDSIPSGGEFCHCFITFEKPASVTKTLAAFQARDSAKEDSKTPESSPVTGDEDVTTFPAVDLMSNSNNKQPTIQLGVEHQNLIVMTKPEYMKLDTVIALQTKFGVSPQPQGKTIKRSLTNWRRDAGANDTIEVKRALAKADGDRRHNAYRSPSLKAEDGNLAAMEPIVLKPTVIPKRDRAKSAPGPAARISKGPPNLETVGFDKTRTGYPAKIEQQPNDVPEQASTEIVG